MKDKTTQKSHIRWKDEKYMGPGIMGNHVEIIWNHMESCAMAMVIYSDDVSTPRLDRWYPMTTAIWLRILQRQRANLRQVTKVCCLFWSCLRIQDDSRWFKMIVCRRFPKYSVALCVGELSTVLDFGYFLPILHNLSKGHGRPRILPILRLRLHMFTVCLHVDCNLNNIE